MRCSDGSFILNRCSFKIITFIYNFMILFNWSFSFLYLLSVQESNAGNEKETSASDENLSEATIKVRTTVIVLQNSSLFCSALLLIYYKSTIVVLCQEKTGGLAGYFKKSPKPAPRAVVTEVIK